MQSIIFLSALLPLALAGPFTIVSRTSGYTANTTVETDWSMSNISNSTTGFVLNLMNGDANAATTVATLASNIAVNATGVIYLLPATLKTGSDYFLQLCELGVGAFSNTICSYSARFPITGISSASTTTSDPTDDTTDKSVPTQVHSGASSQIPTTIFTLSLLALVAVTL